MALAVPPSVNSPPAVETSLSASLLSPPPCRAEHNKEQLARTTQAAVKKQLKQATVHYKEVPRPPRPGLAPHRIAPETTGRQYEGSHSLRWPASVTRL
ncbi:hypothetical protein Slin15195_G130700 [Septoria linicola]|uniref:Uncharacterized protein n=1 Tax=Septoria linicola TaxID=215465 RepID=A0A9Q9B9Y4_9PEZI|nr:hypothetical protein Slin14017_G128330 [Septoria linicola]USW59751.1 hypothetical protein Slin15195_G130700 [Septoria linicola]